MIESKYEEQTVKQKVKISEIMTCDICGKEIRGHTYYYGLTTGHDDWGNDSYESVQSYHICSGDCLRKALDSYIDRSKGFDNTEYFDVEHELYRKSIENHLCYE